MHGDRDPDVGIAVERPRRIHFWVGLGLLALAVLVVVEFAQSGREDNGLSGTVLLILLVAGGLTLARSRAAARERLRLAAFATGATTGAYVGEVPPEQLPDVHFDGSAGGDLGGGGGGDAGAGGA